VPLTETAIRAAQPREKPYKLTDGGGLALVVNPNGSKWWRWRYNRADGRENMLSLGVYPDVNLKMARERRDEARRLRAQGVDLSMKRQSEKAALADTFEAVATEWLALLEKPAGSAVRAPIAAVTLQKKQGWLKDFIFPYIGQRPIRAITPAELLKVLKRIESRGIHETAHRVRSLCSHVFRYAIATDRAERDITFDLRGALAPVVTTNRAAITEPARIGELLRAINGYRGQPATEYALKLAPLLFVRPGELRKAEWRELDFDRAEWRIPAARMKMREQHVVPLSRQAVELLRDLHCLTGSRCLLFPSLRSVTRPISENTINAALRRLGFSKDEMTAHGFRAMASTCLNEQGWHPDVIELQLAHAERDEVRGAYNRAQRLDDRRKMMQAWADYLDGLRAGGNVVPIHHQAA
jgi:integrase